MSLLLDALKKSGDTKTSSLSELELEDIQVPPLRKSSVDTETTTTADARTTPVSAPPASQKTSSGRAAGENLFAAKKKLPKKSIKLGIVPISLILGGIFGSVYGFYVYLEITPPNQRFWYSPPPQPQHLAAPVATPGAPPVAAPVNPPVVAPKAPPTPVVVATAPTLVPLSQPSPAVTPAVAEAAKPLPKETPRAVKPQTKKFTEPRPVKAPIENNAALNIQHQPQPDSIDLTLTAAYQAYKNGDLETASQRYRDALSKDPKNRDALLGLAAITQQQGQDENAALYYRRVLTLDPRDPVALAALTSFGPGDPSSKESRLNQLVTQQPESAALHFALGNQYADQSRWAEAQQAYFNALALEPGNALFAFSVAISLDHIGQRNAAAQYYRKALQFDTSGNSGFNREQTQQRLNQLTSH